MSAFLGPSAAAALIILATSARALAEDADRARLHGQVAPGRPGRHTLTLAAGRYVRLRAEGMGAEVALSVAAPDGRIAAEASTLTFPPGSIEFSMVTEQAGHHRVEARLLPGGGPGGYSLALVEDRPAADADSIRIRAERAYFEAESLRIKGEGDSLRAARARYESARTAARDAGDAALEADAMTGLARVTDALGDKKGALQQYADALDRQRALGRLNAVANVLNFAAMVHNDFLGERPRALALLDEALAVARQAGDRRIEGITLGNMGVVHLLSDRMRALDYYEKSLVLHRQAGNPRGQATVLSNIGQIHDLMGERSRALEYMQQAVPVRQAVGEPKDLAATLNNIGVLYRNTDEVARAVDFFQQALEQWRRGGNRDGEAATLHNLASVHEAAGDYQPALDLYHQALRLFRETASRVREANCLTSLGRLYATLGDHRQALALLQDALAVQRAVGNKSFEASTLSNLGDVWSARGDHARAAELFAESLTLAREVSDRLREATAFLALGRAKAALGATTEALAFYAQAAEVNRALPRPRGEAAANVQAAAAQLVLGDHRLGIQQAGRSLATFRELGDRPGEAFALFTLARLEMALGDLVAARRHAEEALETVETLRSRITGQELRSSYLSTVQSYYALLVEVLVRLHQQRPGEALEAEAFRVVERARARSLLDILAEARAGIRSGLDPQLLERQRHVQQALNSKAARQARLLGEEAKAETLATLSREIDDLTRQLTRLRAEVRAQSPRYAALTEPEPATVGDIQSQLDDESLLLEYALGEERSFVWVVSRSTLTVHELPRRSVVEDAARRFVDAIRRAPSRGDSISPGELGPMLLAPMGRLRAQRLVVVADGALLMVPFSALVSPATGRALVRDHEVVSLPSASTLGVLRREAVDRPRTTRTVAVLADPVFDRQDPRVRARLKAAAEAPAEGVPDAVQRAGLSRLLGSRREALAILGLAAPRASWRALDFQASREAAADPQLGRFRIVHFATHGVLDDVRPDLSGVVLSLVDERGRARDGFLRLHEVYNLRLGADLVVLSACQTGLGQEVRGEGLVGLTRGFMYAGAPRVVASLWKVDDSATTELMRRFYAGMLGPRRMAPSAALREAQAAVAAIPRWRSPYYWAGFVLQGDWR